MKKISNICKDDFQVDESKKIVPLISKYNYNYEIIPNKVDKIIIIMIRSMFFVIIVKEKQNRCSQPLEMLLLMAILNNLLKARKIITFLGIFIVAKLMLLYLLVKKLYYLGTSFLWNIHIII